jgi:hypothetical protein
MNCERQECLDQEEMCKHDRLFAMLYNMEMAANELRVAAYNAGQIDDPTYRKVNALLNRTTTLAETLKHKGVK